MKEFLISLGLALLIGVASLLLIRGFFYLAYHGYGDKLEKIVIPKVILDK